MKLIEEFIKRQPDEMIYHYTNAVGLIGILKTRSVWATSHLHLNDGLEFEIAPKLLKEELGHSSFAETQRELFIELIQKVQEQRFILSFSQHGDLLSQWRAYSLGGDGYALGFSVGNPIFQAAQDKAFNLIKCEYDSEQQRKLCNILVSEFGDVLTSNQPISEHDLPQKLRAAFMTYNWTYALALLSASFKHKGFSEEGEWRLVSQYPDDLVPDLAYRTGRFGITPYYPLPICAGAQCHIDRIVIGPTANKRAAEASVKRALKTYKFDATQVTFSDTSLRQ